MMDRTQSAKIDMRNVIILFANELVLKGWWSGRRKVETRSLHRLVKMYAQRRAMGCAIRLHCVKTSLLGDLQHGNDGYGMSSCEATPDFGRYDAQAQG